MASYHHPQFYSQPDSQFSPTSNTQPSEFALPFYDPSYAGFGAPFDIGTAAPHDPLSVLPLPRGNSPVHDASSNSGNSRGGRGSSEEKELTAGQRRRKEQNRAAQRAFRERKERHVKELEMRLASLEQANTRATAENNKLKEQLEKTLLENRLLLENSFRSGSPPMLPEVGPMGFKPIDAEALGPVVMGGNPPSNFTTPIFHEHPNRGPIHRITTSPRTGEKLLAAGAAWDLIMCHPLYEQGLVDIGDISERLKNLARCDGQGPVFEESVILDAIQASSGSGRDELLVSGCLGNGY